MSILAGRQFIPVTPRFPAAGCNVQEQALGVPQLVGLFFGLGVAYLRTKTGYKSPGIVVLETLYPVHVPPVNGHTRSSADGKAKKNPGKPCVFRGF